VPDKLKRYHIVPHRKIGEIMPFYWSTVVGQVDSIPLVQIKLVACSLSFVLISDYKFIFIQSNQCDNAQSHQNHNPSIWSIYISKTKCLKAHDVHYRTNKNYTYHIVPRRKKNKKLYHILWVIDSWTLIWFPWFRSKLWHAHYHLFYFQVVKPIQINVSLNSKIKPNICLDIHVNIYKPTRAYVHQWSRNPS
jgi:hypothetical protein